MTQITINVEDKSTLSLLKRLIKELPGASLAKPLRKKKTPLEKSLEEIARGEYITYNSSEDFFKAMGI